MVGGPVVPVTAGLLRGSRANPGTGRITHTRGMGVDHNLWILGFACQVSIGGTSLSIADHPWSGERLDGYDKRHKSGAIARNRQYAAWMVGTTPR